ncbi:MAG: HDIG domain-containing protein [Deltaproteobacteria bacterium]|nr:HDIG domain-containing protein [Deltaproteobacteria bacterium]
MARAEALDLLREHCKEEVLIKHSLATGAVMQALAKRLGRDPHRWGIVGLLHDLDYDETRDDPPRHTLRTEEILREQRFEEEIIDAIKAHNAEALSMKREKPLHYAITCADSITGLIVATTLVYPDKRIASVRPSSILKRMKEKGFARGVRRDAIRECEKLGLGLEEFAEMSLKAMQGISDQLGL